MSLIKCNECNEEVSDKAKSCPNCGCPLKKKKAKVVKDDKKKSSNILKTIMLVLCFSLLIAAVVMAIITFLPSQEEELSSEEINEKICEEYVDMLQEYIDDKDVSGFDSNWQNHEPFSPVDGCSTYECVCPAAWDLFAVNKKNKAEKFLSQGFVSSAYNAMGSNYIDEHRILRDYFDSNDLFKLISSKQKEDITGIYHSFGSWNWEYQVGGSFHFNKQYVSYGSSSLVLTFDDYSDKVLISGHLVPYNHPNWNSEKNVSVNWYNYKVIDNKIYIKAEYENDSQYDSLFEIVSITDTTLSLRLLMNMEDVNAGQVYVFNYERT